MSDPQIDWSSVRRVLVVRLRSIGDTVLSTPSLIALKRFLPNSQVDILLEDWVAPLLTEFDSLDEVLIAGDSLSARLAVAREIRARQYDVVFNLHGGTTATFFTAASRARHRVGYANYQYSFLHNHLLTSSAEFWGRPRTHSAEQQLALLGYAGVPVQDLPKGRLVVSLSSFDSAEAKVRAKVDHSIDELGAFALFHPAAAYATKTWSADNFARVAEFLSERGMRTLAVAAPGERDVLEELRRASKVPIATFDDLSLPEITALASRARIFVGNDSGIAHIAAAVETPTVVVFGSSNRDHWRPWTDSRNEIVFETFACQPCSGRECKEFGDPKCILSVRVESVLAAIDRVIG